MTPDETRAHLAAVVEQTQALIARDWVDEDSPTPVECRRPTGEVGATFTTSRHFEGAAPSDAELEAVAALWEQRGLLVGRGPRAIGALLGVDQSDPAFYLQLRVTDEASWLSGQAPCVEGDAIALAQPEAAGD